MDTIIHSEPMELLAVDGVIEAAVAAGNPHIITNFANQELKVHVLRGKTLAKALWGLKDKWPLFQQAGYTEEWDSFAAANIINVQPGTVRHYVDMWETIFVKADLDADLRNNLLTITPIKDLLLLTPGVREGDITPEHLSEVPLKEHRDIQKMVTSLRGGNTSTKNRVTGVIVMKEGDRFIKGSLYAVGYDDDGNAVREVIALLNLDPSTKAGKIMLERIKDLPYVFEKE